jgi:hypothetical protein
MDIIPPFWVYLLRQNLSAVLNLSGESTREFYKIMGAIGF